MSWIKPAVVLRSLQLGHAVMVAGAAAACRLACWPLPPLPCPVLPFTIPSAALALSSHSPTCHPPAASILPDTDIAYTRKPVWDSYLELINTSMTDGAFMAEDPGGPLQAEPGRVSGQIWAETGSSSSSSGSQLL